jgi:hypothetical protein
MPRRELNCPEQIESWLSSWGERLTGPGSLTLIGSAGLLWHAFQRGIDTALPENSMDVDPVTNDEEVALLAYECLIGSEFEAEHGWHVNLMPRSVLDELPQGWEVRSITKHYENLEVRVPSAEDLLAPKRRRDEPRDRAHDGWAREIGLIKEME